MVEDAILVGSGKSSRTSSKLTSPSITKQTEVGISPFLQICYLKWNCLRLKLFMKFDSFLPSSFRTGKYLTSSSFSSWFRPQPQMNSSSRSICLNSTRKALQQATTLKVAYFQGFYLKILPTAAIGSISRQNVKVGLASQNYYKVKKESSQIQDCQEQESGGWVLNFRPWDCQERQYSRTSPPRTKKLSPFFRRGLRSFIWWQYTRERQGVTILLFRITPVLSAMRCKISTLVS